MYARWRMPQRQRAISPLDRRETCRVWLDKVKRFRQAGCDVYAVLSGSGRDFKHPNCPERCWRQAQRSIKTVATIKMCLQLDKMIMNRNDAMFSVIRQMAAAGL